LITQIRNKTPTPKWRLALLPKKSDEGHFAYDEERGPGVEVNSMKKSGGNVGGIGTDKTKTTALIVHDIQRANERTH
jgi:hypothetical protein